jgi:hypothetical protein
MSPKAHGLTQKCVGCPATCVWDVLHHCTDVCVGSRDHAGLVEASPPARAGRVGDPKNRADDGENNSDYPKDRNGKQETNNHEDYTD